MRNELENRVSYIRKPLAENGYLCLGLACAAVAMGAAGMYLSVINQGNSPLSVVAICFASMVFSGLSVYIGVLAFKEKDKNTVLAKIGAGIGGILLIQWLLMLLVGLRT
ncbi:MAG: calcium:proton exchanger [Clostridium sp.]|nr:calcium:proton exchanger [Clostridium sp.]